MDSGQAFESQLERVLTGAAGPAQPTDVAAIVQSVASPRGSRFAGFFGATRALVAAAVVALLGGFLVLSLLTADETDAPIVGDSPSPSATAQPDLQPPGLTTESLAPGIVRVVDDGADHKLSDFPENEYAAGFDHVAVDGDGGILVYSPSGSVFGVGQAGTDPAPAYDEGGLERLEVPDVDMTGSTWGRNQVARVAPGADWGDLDATDLATQLEEALRDPDFMGYPEDVWGQIAASDDGETCELAITSDGMVWGGACGVWGGGFGSGALARLDDGVWKAVEPFIGTEREDVHVSDANLLAPGPNGDLWVVALSTTMEHLESLYRDGINGSLSGPLKDDPFRGRVLLHFDGESWSAYPWASVGGSEEAGYGEVIHAVDDAGRIWIAVGENVGMAEGDYGGLPGMATLLSFDGESTSWHPDIGPIRGLASHPDGSIWVAARDGVFIIDPAAAHAGSSAGVSAPRYSITDETVAGLVTTEVEPFVVRVEHDGIRSLPQTNGGSEDEVAPVRYSEIAAGPDGSVWLFDGDRLTRLGHADTDFPQPPAGAADFAVHRDGTLWHASSLDEGPVMLGTIGAEPAAMLSGPELSGPTQVAVHPDGTVFGAWLNEDDDTVVGALGDGPEWRGQPRIIEGRIDELYISDGEIWARQGGSLVNGDWDDPGWRHIAEPAGVTEQVSVGLSGAVALVRTEPDGEYGLAQLRDTEWSIEPLELPDGLAPDPDGPFEASPRGFVWIGLSEGDDCAGVARLDGPQTFRFLEHECIRQLAVALDGAVWLQTGGDEREIYVIRP